MASCVIVEEPPELSNAALHTTQDTNIIERNRPLNLDLDLNSDLPAVLS